MYNRRRTNNIFWRLPLLAILLAACIYLIFFRFNEPSEPQTPLPATRPVVAEPGPIERALLASTQPTQREGTGVVLLVDVSGSMSMPVAGIDGKPSPKIEIVRRCAVNFMQRMTQFTAEHKDTPLLAGVYEFSLRGRSDPMCRVIVPIAPPDPAKIEAAAATMDADGGTPTGEAIIKAKSDLNATGLRHQHIVVITDGECNKGADPATVAAVLSRLPESQRAALSVIPFDISADKFTAMQNAGATVIPAKNEAELAKAIDSILARIK